MGLEINKNLKKNRSIQWFSNKELYFLQNKKLYNILSHCEDNVSYYKNIFIESNFDLKGDLFQEIKQIPILTKKIIKENLARDISYRICNFFMKIDLFKLKFCKLHCSVSTPVIGN